MDLPGVDLVEELHEDEGVEDDGVVLRGRGVERGVAAAVDVQQPLTWRRADDKAVYITCCSYRRGTCYRCVVTGVLLQAWYLLQVCCYRCGTCDRCVVTGVVPVTGVL